VLATGCDMKDKEVEFEDADSISYFWKRKLQAISTYLYQRLELTHVMQSDTVGERVAVVKRFSGEIKQKISPAVSASS
jgi:hypothetical protein